MNTNKAVYWIALAAVAFGLSSEYQRGGFACLHDLANCARSRVSGLTIRAEQAVLAMSVLTGRSPVSLDKHSMAVETTEMAGDVEHQVDIDRVVAEHRAEIDGIVAAHEVELARLQARLTRSQAVLVRANVGRLRVLEGSHLKMTTTGNHHLITICPQTGRKIRIEAGPDAADIQMDMPTVEVGDQF